MYIHLDHHTNEQNIPGFHSLQWSDVCFNVLVLPLHSVLVIYINMSHSLLHTFLWGIFYLVCIAIGQSSTCFCVKDHVDYFVTLKVLGIWTRSQAQLTVFLKYTLQVHSKDLNSQIPQYAYNLTTKYCVLIQTLDYKSVIVGIYGPINHEIRQ